MADGSDGGVNGCCDELWCVVVEHVSGIVSDDEMSAPSFGQFEMIQLEALVQLDQRGGQLRLRRRDSQHTSDCAADHDSRRGQHGRMLAVLTGACGQVDRLTTWLGAVDQQIYGLVAVQEETQWRRVDED